MNHGEKGLTSRLPDIDVERLDPQRREIVAIVAGERGRLPTPYRVWIQNPPLAEALHPLGQLLARRITLSRREAELAILLAAHRCGSAYVLAVHAKESLALGLPSRVVTAISQGYPAELEDPRLKAIADILGALAADGIPPRKVFDTAVETLGHDGIAEVLALVGYFTGVGLVMKLYDVPAPAQSATAAG